MSVFIHEDSMSSVLFDGYTSNTVVFENGVPVVTTEILYPASHASSPAPTVIPLSSMQDPPSTGGCLHLGKGIDGECVAGPQSSPLLAVSSVSHTNHFPNAVLLQSLPVSGVHHVHVPVVSTAPFCRQTNY